MTTAHAGNSHGPPTLAEAKNRTARGTAQPVLSIRGLHVEFTSDDSIARGVENVDLDVARGEILALVGETGSGKTITARAVLGLLPPRAIARGKIFVAGQQVLGLEDRELRAVRGAQVSMVFQEPSTALNPVQTVGWQIREAIRAHRKVSRRGARDRAVELLRLVDIPEPERRVGFYPHQLSGGQRQRVVIALALANEPQLIIADEPTTALDVTVQAEILRLLRDLRDRLGTSVLLITHNLGVVADLADRVVVLREGQVVEVADVGPLFAAPRADYTRELIRVVPRLGTALVESAEQRESTESPASADAAVPVLALSDIMVEYAGSSVTAVRPGPSTASACSSLQARCSASSGSLAPVRRLSGVLPSGSPRRRPDKCSCSAPIWRRRRGRTCVGCVAGSVLSSRTPQPRSTRD